MICTICKEPIITEKSNDSSKFGVKKNDLWHCNGCLDVLDLFGDETVPIKNTKPIESKIINKVEPTYICIYCKKNTTGKICINCGKLSPLYNRKIKK
jgi:hypothetical protein